MVKDAGEAYALPLASVRVLARWREAPPYVALAPIARVRALSGVAVHCSRRRGYRYALPPLRAARVYTPSWTLASRTLRGSRFGRPALLLPRVAPWAARNARAPVFDLVTNDDLFNKRHAKRSLQYAPQPAYSS